MPRKRKIVASSSQSVSFFPHALRKIVVSAEKDAFQGSALQVDRFGCGRSAGKSAVLTQLDPNV